MMRETNLFEYKDRNYSCESKGELAHAICWARESEIYGS